MAEQEVGQKGKTYGLLLPKKGQNKIQIKSVFGNESDDESAHAAVNTSLQKEAQKSKVKRQTQLEIDKALEADPTVYEYDSIYDSMQEKKAQQLSAASDKSKVEKKPRYIAGLLKASENRKREYERQQERIVQKEREKEGDEFADKEVFVTSAYRKKMQEMQEAEEEERRQAQIEAMLDVKKQKDMTGFYRYLLNEKTGENIKPDETKSAPQNVETGDQQSEENVGEEDDEMDDVHQERKQLIKKEQRENKERRQYRPRKSSSSRSSSRSMSPDRSVPKRSRSSSVSSNDEHHTEKLLKKRSRSNEKDKSKDTVDLLPSKNKTSRLDTKQGEKDQSLQRDNDKYESNSKNRTQKSRSSSLSDGENEPPKTSKANKTDENKENKKKIDKQLTVEEIKARYARRTTETMIEAARERYFLRKIERDQTKPYIFKSDE